VIELGILTDRAMIFTPSRFVHPDVILVRALALGGTLRPRYSFSTVDRHLGPTQRGNSRRPHRRSTPAYGPSTRLRQVSGWHLRSECGLLRFPFPRPVC